MTIMSSTLAYLTSRADFAQVSSDIPVTKTRNAEKVDSEEVFNGAFIICLFPSATNLNWRAPFVCVSGRVWVI